MQGLATTSPTRTQRTHGPEDGGRPQGGVSTTTTAFPTATATRAPLAAPTDVALLSRSQRAAHTTGTTSGPTTRNVRQQALLATEGAEATTPRTRRSRRPALPIPATIAVHDMEATVVPIADHRTGAGRRRALGCIPAGIVATLRVHLVQATSIAS